MVNSTGDNQSEQLQLNLLENALDSLLSAAEAVRRDEGPRSLKEAVLHLANGVELLIKARLVREDWALIFFKPEDASPQKLAGGDFRSVDFQRAVERLDKIAKIQLDKNTIILLKNLRRFRNRLTHFTTKLDSAQTKSLVAKSMSFCVEFCEQQGMAIPDYESALGEIHQNLDELQEFVDERLKTISEEWKDAFMMECPQCLRRALVIDGGDVHCKFCRQNADPRELAESNADGHIGDCPECGEESAFTFVIYNNDNGEWICFSCGIRGENYDNCFRCDQLTYTHEVGGVVFCEICWSDILRD